MPVVEWLLGTTAGGAVFLRRESNDRTSCFIGFPTCALAGTPVEPHGRRSEFRVSEKTLLGPLYTQNPSFRQWAGVKAELPAILPGDFAVDGRVERGVVVHLQLAVNFEATGALERLAPELVKAGG